MTVLSIPVDQSLYQQTELVAEKQGMSIVGYVTDMLKRCVESTPTWSYAIEHDEELGQYVVSDSVVHAYGVGETVDEALKDYRMMMLDMYENLSNNVDRLSPRLERQYKALSLQLKQKGLIEVN